MVTQLNSSTFPAFIQQGVAVVDFYADWCGPCKMMAPVLDSLSTELTQVAFGKVDVEVETSISDEYQISSLPTLIVFRDGKPVRSIIGAQGADSLRKAILE